MKKFLLGPILAALAVFLWGFIYWGAPPFLAYKGLGHVADSSATALEIGKLLPASGAYLLPSPLDGMDKMQELGIRGPMVEVHIVKEGMTSSDQTKGMIFGFLHMFILCVLASGMLCGLAKAFVCWTCRVRFCAMLGLIVATADLGATIWWHHSLAWTLAQAVYDFASFTIIGLVLAKFVTPKEVPSAITI